MFRRLKVDPNKNWWEVRRNYSFYIFKQVAFALRGKELAFFIEHPLDLVFSWKDLDNWLKDHGVRLDGPSQFNGIMHFDGLTDEAKDTVHFRETRASAIYALQMWSHFRGDKRMIGTIDNSKIGSELLGSDGQTHRWKNPDYKYVADTHDGRAEWIYGNAKISDPPLTEYFVTKRDDLSAYWKRTRYEFDHDRSKLTATGGWLGEPNWPALNLIFQFPRNARQYSKFYD